jgi:predicted transcriptional regulator
MPIAGRINRIEDGAVTTAKLADDAVTTAKITDLNITTAKIAAANVTKAKTEDAISDNIVLAWVSFNGTGTPAIEDDFNVSTITDNGYGS